MFNKQSTPSPNSKSDYAQSWNAISAFVGVVTTFFLAPILIKITGTFVSSYSASQYGFEWVETSMFLWAVLVVVGTYWGSYMLAYEHLAKRLFR